MSVGLRRILTFQSLHVAFKVVSLPCLIILNSCGYNAVNTTSVFGFPAITVLPFIEKTPVGIGVQIADLVGRELATGGMLVKTGNHHQADGFLRGRIQNARTTLDPDRSGPNATVTIYRVVLGVDAQLCSQENEEIWQGTFTLQEEFLPAQGAPDKDRLLRTESQRRKAFMRLAEKAARKISEEIILQSAIAPLPNRNKRVRKCAPMPTGKSTSKSFSAYLGQTSPAERKP